MLHVCICFRACCEKSVNNHSETLITLSMFFDMSFQENVKNVIKTRFLNFEKKCKIRILEQRNQSSRPRSQPSRPRVNMTDLFKLVNSEDPSRVTAVWSHFLSEAGRHSGIADRQVLGSDPLVAMERCYWLFWRSYQILLFNALFVRVLAPSANHLHSADTQSRSHATVVVE